MATQSQWIEIENSSFLQPKEVEIRGVQVNVYVAPHDIPQRIRGQKDQNTNLFVIEIEYLDPEKFTRKIPSQDGHVQFYVGKNSGRVGKIEVDVGALDVQAVELRVRPIADALEKLEQGTQKQSQRFNYEAVRAVIEKEFSKILHPVCA